MAFTSPSGESPFRVLDLCPATDIAFSGGWVACLFVPDVQRGVRLFLLSGEPHIAQRRPRLVSMSLRGHLVGVFLSLYGYLGFFLWLPYSVGVGF